MRIHSMKFLKRNVIGKKSRGGQPPLVYKGTTNMCKCIIGFENSYNKKIGGIVCNNGSPENIGKLLLKSYNNFSDLYDLLQQGEIISLGNTPNESIPILNSPRTGVLFLNRHDLKIRGRAQGVIYFYIFTEQQEWLFATARSFFWHRLNKIVLKL